MAFFQPWGGEGGFAKFRPIPGFSWGNPGRLGNPRTRLPEYFGKRAIKWHVPFSQSAQIEIAANETRLVSEKDLLINIDKPIQIHRLAIRFQPATVFVLNSDTPDIPVPHTSDIVPETLMDRVKLAIVDLAKDQTLVRRPVDASAMFSRDTGFWEWEEPYTYVRSERFQIEVQTGTFPDFCARICDLSNTGEPLRVATLRLSFCMQGYNIVIAPPSETR